MVIENWKTTNPLRVNTSLIDEDSIPFKDIEASRPDRYIAG
jgi:hypothetical protein